MAGEALTSALPRITPLVLERRAEAFDNDGWLFELKYDGFRALLEIDGAGARLVSRNRNRLRRCWRSACASPMPSSSRAAPYCSRSHRGCLR